MFDRIRSQISFTHDKHEIRTLRGHRETGIGRNWLLVEFARHRGRQKRGGDPQRVTLDSVPEIAHERSPDLVALDGVLSELAKVDASHEPGRGTAVLWRIDCRRNRRGAERVAGDGLREWKTAKVWLLRELSRSQVTDRPSDGLVSDQ